MYISIHTNITALRAKHLKEFHTPLVQNTPVPTTNMLKHL